MSFPPGNESHGGDPRLPTTGALIDRKYRLGTQLGSGAMGVVFAARHELLRQDVAIKFLSPDFVGATTPVARFFNEARAAARIKNDHVCRVLDFGVLPSGSPYLVMERLDGEDLSRVIEARGPLPIQQAVDYVLQGLEAIAEAHTLGIVHRDLKPANLFVARRPDGSTRIKVLDFGVSKVASPEPALSLTATAVPLGSPAYMSPEQVRDPKSVDARTDLWSMGVILYEMLAGRSPFSAPTLGEMFAEILEREIKPLRTHRPDVSPALEEALSRCLRRDREERFRDAAALAEALVGSGSSQAAVSLARIRGVLRGAPALETALPSEHPEASSTARGRRSWWRRGVGMMVVALIVAAAGLAILRRSPAPPPVALPAAPPPAARPEPALPLPPAIPSPSEGSPPAAGPAPAAAPVRRRPTAKRARPQAPPRAPQPPARPRGILDDRQ